jgi:hypothetical protein
MPNQDTQSLLCTDLSIWPTFGNPGAISDAIHASSLLKEQFINRLLLYDRIVIPSGNLLIIAVLRLWLGDIAFRLLLENDVIQLVRYDSWFCYVGNGGGLKFFQLLPGDEPHTREHNLGTLNFAPLDETISKILQFTNPITGETERKQLEKLLHDKIRPLAISKYQDKLKHETYQDIIKSPLLRSFFAIRNTNLDRLKGIAPNQVVIEDFHSANSSNVPEIKAVLNIAFENLMLTFATETANTIQGGLSSEAVLKAKGQRLGLGDPQLQGFLDLLNLEGLPNVGKAFAEGEIDFQKIVSLRESVAARNFREWLTEVDPLNKDEVLGAYIKKLKEPSVIERAPVKTIRFIVTSALGKIPGLGEVASFIDSFLLEKWFKGRSPKVLMDEIRRVVVKPPERAKGSLRNKPCPCGSGKKYKKCHGS